MLPLNSGETPHPSRPGEADRGGEADAGVGAGAEGHVLADALGGLLGLSGLAKRAPSAGETLATRGLAVLKDQL